MQSLTVSKKPGEKKDKSQNSTGLYVKEGRPILVAPMKKTSSLFKIEPPSSSIMIGKESK